MGTWNWAQKGERGGWNKKLCQEDSSDSSNALDAGMQIQKKHEQEILTNYKNDEDNDLTEITDAH